MRVLHIITGLTTGGAERALYNVLAGGLAEAGESTVLSLQDEGTYGQRIRALGVPVYAIGIRRGIPTPLAVWRLRRMVVAVRPQLVQGWMYHGNLAATAAARLVSSGRPAVAWNIRHSLYLLAKERLLTRQVIRANRWASSGADAIIYNSRLSKAQHEAFGFASGKALVIPNGFDTFQLCPDSLRGSAIRKALDIPTEATVIGHVARFHPMKDHASFLCAAVEVMRQRPDVICLVAGREVSPSIPALANIVPPELEGRFRFVGERGDVADLMRAMDLLCLSSAWGEAFPNVLGEAMALGVPCVATNIGDSRYIVGDTGSIVPPSDSSALKQGLMAILDKCEQQRRELGEAARERIEANFAMDAVVEQYAHLYRRLEWGEAT